MQVKIKKTIKGISTEEWVSIFPTGGKAYTWDTEDEARKMLDICYPLMIYGEEKRIMETPYPHCYHPEECVKHGRCTAAINCGE